MLWFRCSCIWGKFQSILFDKRQEQAFTYRVLHGLTNRKRCWTLSFVLISISQHSIQSLVHIHPRGRRRFEEIWKAPEHHFQFVSRLSLRACSGHILWQKHRNIETFLFQIICTHRQFISKGGLFVNGSLHGPKIIYEKVKLKFRVCFCVSPPHKRLYPWGLLSLENFQNFELEG